MEIQEKITELTNGLHITTKDKKDIDEYINHGEWGLAFEALCVAIEGDRINISQNDYKTIRTLGSQMEMDHELWSGLTKYIIK